MRRGWTCKEAAPVLEVHEHRVSQALDPALTKIAKLWRMDPTRTMEAILAAAHDLEPMTDRELDLRQRMGTLRADRSEVHPQR